MFPNDEQRQESSGFFGTIGSFLWSAVKFVAAAAMVLAGVAFFSKSGADWIDRQTGTGIGTTLNNAKDKSWDWVKSTLGIKPPEPPASARTDDISQDRAKAVAIGAAVPTGLAAVRSTPAVIVAGADATKLGAQKIAGLIPEGSGAIFSPVTQAARDVARLINPFKPISDAAVSATTAASVVNTAQAAGDVAAATRISPGLAQAVAQTASAAGKAATSTTTIAEIGANLAAKAAPAFKVAGRAAGPVGAAVGVATDGYHTYKLAGEGKTGSAIAQGVGTGIETVGFFTGPIGIAVGSVGKEIIGTADNLITDNRNVTRSAIGGALDMIPGVTAAQEAVSVGMVRAVQAPADAWNYVTGNTDDALMKEGMAKRTAERVSQLSSTAREKFDKVKAAMISTPELSNKPGFDPDFAALIAVTTDNIPADIAQKIETPSHGLSASARTNTSPREKS